MIDHTPHPPRLQFAPDSFLHHVEGASGPIAVTFASVSSFDGQRHGPQHRALPPETAKRPLFASPNPLNIPLHEHCRAFQLHAPDGVTISTRNGRPLFAGQTLYLFNVLVALEWLPSNDTLQQLVAAFRSASDFFYDVTDGAMAFGQVVFGGAELFAAADIVLLASNRYHPRSWMDGLHTPTKYSPIRVGRGTWHKNNSVLIPWDEPESYRALVHEWGHYALNLLDEYLNDSALFAAGPDDATQLLPAAAGSGAATYPLVVPRTSLPVESIMATLEGTSELVPQQRRGDAAHRDRVQQRIAKHYPAADFTGPVDEGPYHVPFALPTFHTTNRHMAQSQPGANEECRVAVDDLALDHCWLYVLRQDEDGAPARLIPQGSLDARSRSDPRTGLPGDGFVLLGARPGDVVLAVGTDPAGRLTTQRYYITNDARGYALGSARDATPPAWPVVAVLPSVPARVTIGAFSNTATTTPIRVHVAGDHPPDAAWLFELGAQRGRSLALHADGTALISEKVDVTQLDGQVLLCWRGANGQLDRYAVADYSKGGGPESSIKAPEPPMSAGSSDGNAMLFFAYTDPPLKKDHPDYSTVRIVTTRNYGGLEAGLAAGAAPRSYLFSLASSQAIPQQQVSPTLVVNFDQDALSHHAALQVQRYDPEAGMWQPTPSYQPLGAFFMASPLLPGPGGAAPLDPAGARPVEYYRLYAIRDSIKEAGTRSPTAS